MTANSKQNPDAAGSTRQNSKALTFRLDPAAHRQLKIMAAEDGRTVTSIVTEGLNYMFEQRGLPRIC